MLKKELNKLFKNLKIYHNDNIILHSNSAGLHQFGRSKKKNLFFFKTFFNEILKKLGKKGTLVVPTYNYDFPKGKIFNADLVNSQVGILSNYFLKKFSKVRTSDPVFSHAIRGKLQNILAKSQSYECFGPDSFFEKIHNLNFKIVGFCCPINSMTFLHYIEKKRGVKYRFNKKFKSRVINNYKMESKEIKYFVGKKNLKYQIKNSKLELAFKNYRKFNICNFGRFYCWSITANDCYNKISNLIKKKNDYLIK